MVACLRRSAADRGELPLRKFGVGRSPSGKAPDFGSGIEGSNPSRPARFYFSGLFKMSKSRIGPLGVVLFQRVVDKV